jgi:hypothetical protein
LYLWAPERKFDTNRKFLDVITADPAIERLRRELSDETKNTPDSGSALFLQPLFPGSNEISLVNFALFLA